MRVRMSLCMREGAGVGINGDGSPGLPTSEHIIDPF